MSMYQPMSLFQHLLNNTWHIKLAVSLIVLPSGVLNCHSGLTSICVSNLCIVIKLVHPRKQPPLTYSLTPTTIFKIMWSAVWQTLYQVGFTAVQIPENCTHTYLFFSFVSSQFHTVLRREWQLIYQAINGGHPNQSLYIHLKPSFISNKHLKTIILFKCEWKLLDSMDNNRLSENNNNGLFPLCGIFHLPLLSEQSLIHKGCNLI